MYGGEEDTAQKFYPSGALGSVPPGRLSRSPPNVAHAGGKSSLRRALPGKQLSRADQLVQAPALRPRRAGGAGRRLRRSHPCSYPLRRARAVQRVPEGVLGEDGAVRRRLSERQGLDARPLDPVRSSRRGERVSGGACGEGGEGGEGGAVTGSAPRPPQIKGLNSTYPLYDRNKLQITLGKSGISSAVSPDQFYLYIRDPLGLHRVTCEYYSAELTRASRYPVQVFK